jgi:hypothetical protein
MVQRVSDQSPHVDNEEQRDCSGWKSAQQREPPGKWARVNTLGVLAAFLAR